MRGSFPKEMRNLEINLTSEAITHPIRSHDWLVTIITTKIKDLKQILIPFEIFLIYLLKSTTPVLERFDAFSVRLCSVSARMTNQSSRSTGWTPRRTSSSPTDWWTRRSWRSWRMWVFSWENFKKIISMRRNRSEGGDWWRSGKIQIFQLPEISSHTSGLKDSEQCWSTAWIQSCLGVL